MRHPQMIISPVKISFTEEDRRDILRQIDQTLKSGQLTLGEKGRAFEAEFAAYVGSRFAVAVNSGTSAIEIPLRVLGVERKEILMPTNTFFATPAAVLHAGGRVRFVDADPATLSVSVASLRENVTRDTVGVIVVHVAGIVTPDMPEIQTICRERGLFLLEDAAHAHGSRLGDQMAGTFGDAGSFSFYPTKVITSGEGGMIVTDDEVVCQEAGTYRDQGKSGFDTNFHTRLGYNWRMSELHAILGLAQLHRLEQFIEDRRRTAAIYDDGLKTMEGIHPLPLPPECRSNYYKYVALLDPAVDRSLFKKKLREDHRVSFSGEVYETPCHMQPVFQAFDTGSYPNAEDICRRHVCLPIYPDMATDEAEYVLASVTAVLGSL